MNFNACMREITNNSFTNGGCAKMNSSSSHHHRSFTANTGESKSFLGTNASFISDLNSSSLKGRKTPGSVGRKTGKSSTANITPSRNSNLAGAASRTPGGCGGDRYIASRASEMQMEIAQYLLSKSQTCSAASFNSSSHLPSSQGSQGSTASPQKVEYQRIMSENLNGGVTSATVGQDGSEQLRILQFKKEKVPLAPRGYTNTNSAMYNPKPLVASSHKKCLRHIPTTADRVLDAPDIVDDYYLNLLDWNINNFLAVALAGQLFLWDSVSGDINLLLDLESSTDYVSSVCWTANGEYLAVGVSDSTVQLWNVATQQKLRVLKGHAGRVGALTWNEHVLSSGDKTGLIHNHDVRVPNHLINVLNEHTQEVCGLKWSPNGRYLASGGNDNLLHIWPSAANGFSSESTPLYTLSEHQAAVKALAWCPWQHNVLASGGGTVDRHVKLWNCNTGTCLSSTDTESQVCSLLWSNYYKELISAHGYPNFQLTIWKYPQMQPLTELRAHTGRILHMAMSPCGEYVVSAAADETLRIWHCFQIDPETKKRLKDESLASKKIKSTSGKIISTLR